MGEASMVLNWISLYVFLTGEAVEDVAVEFGVSDLESVEGVLLGSDDDFAAGVLMLSLLSSFPFSWGSGGNATARRCFLAAAGCGAAPGSRQSNRCFIHIRCTTISIIGSSAWFSRSVIIHTLIATTIL